MGNEMFTPALADEIVNEILEAIPTVLEAVRPQGGEMMVVMGAVDQEFCSRSYRACIRGRFQP